MSESDKENVQEENEAEKLANQKVTSRTVSEYQDSNEQYMIDYEEAQNISNHQNEVTNNDDRSTSANGDQSPDNEVVIEEVQNVSEHKTSDVQRQFSIDGG